MSTLQEQAELLAERLNDTLNSSVCNEANLSAIEYSNQFVMGQNVTADDIAEEWIPIAGFESHLFLRAYWRFSPNSTGEYLRTDWSAFGLYVWSAKKQPHPLIRLEVDAESDPNAWNVAHLQVHGASQLLGQVWGLLGSANPKGFEDLHLPVGGFHYRPCLEDFVEFLIEENLVRGKEGWRAVIDETRSAYRRAQLFTLVAHNPDTVREALAEYDRRGSAPAG